MIDMSELTESVKGYIEGLQDVLQRKYQISEDKALNMITSSYIMDSLIDYPEETLHDDIEAHADNIYEDQISRTERLLLEAGYEGTIFLQIHLMKMRFLVFLLMIEQYMITKKWLNH